MHKLHILPALSRHLTFSTQVLYHYDVYTYDHSLRVASLAAQIAESMGCEKNMVRKVYISALLHDIGKTLLPKCILNKPGLLTREERTIMHSHSLLGYFFLNRSHIFDGVARIVLHHHERFDGMGYPHGLRDSHIPLESRIISVADNFDALSSTRTYHDALVFEKAVLKINCNASDMFDPLVIKHFNRVLLKQTEAGTLFTSRSTADNRKSPHPDFTVLNH